MHRRCRDTGEMCSDTKLIWYQTYFNIKLTWYRTFFKPNLFDTELIWYRYWTFLIPSLFDTERIWYHIYFIPNLFDTELIFYQAYLITNLYDTELIRYLPYQIPDCQTVNFLDTEFIEFWTCQILNLPDTKFLSISMGDTELHNTELTSEYARRDWWSSWAGSGRSDWTGELGGVNGHRELGAREVTGLASWQGLTVIVSWEGEKWLERICFGPYGLNGDLDTAR